MNVVDLAWCMVCLRIVNDICMIYGAYDKWCNRRILAWDRSVVSHGGDGNKGELNALLVPGLPVMQ